jgi:hypothetical protein
MKAAVTIRRSHPSTAVLVLSQHVESRHAVEVVASGGGFGYQLKDRVLDLDEFLPRRRGRSDKPCTGHEARARDPSPWR